MAKSKRSKYKTQLERKNFNVAIRITEVAKT